MENIYCAHKGFMKKKDVRFMYLFFDNGNYVTLDKSEFIDFDFVFYDKLVNNNNQYVPMVKNGFIKLKISKFKSSRHNSVFINAYDDYNKHRKSYLENRLVNESGIKYIKFFDENNWSRSIVGHFYGEKDGEFLVLKIFDDFPSLEYKKEEFNVVINPLKKKIIESIKIDFENCESFDIYKDEILEINLNMDKKLELTSEDYGRVIEGGYIKIKLKESYFERDIFFFDEIKKYKIKSIIKRLCGDGITNTDICRLYIRYEYAGFGICKTEPIETKNLFEVDENYEDDDFEYLYLSGYCELLDDQSIVIHFGKLI